MNQQYTKYFAGLIEWRSAVLPNFSDVTFRELLQSHDISAGITLSEVW